MKNQMINLARKIGFTSFIEYQAKSLGKGLLSQFEKAIADSKQHAMLSKEIANIKREKAAEGLKSAGIEADILKQRAAKYLEEGNLEATRLNILADETEKAGDRSLRFANKLSKIID